MENVTVSDIVSMFSANKEEAGRTLAYFGKIGVLVRVGVRDNPPDVKKRREVLWSSKKLLTSKEKSV